MVNSNFSKRLLSARQGAAISTRVVAQRLQKKGFSVSHATIANYESGKTIPPLPLVGALADLYGLSINWFLQPEPVLTDVCYRALKKVSMKDKQQFEATAQRWLEGYRRLEIKLGKRLSNKMTDFEMPDDTNGKLMAERLRKHLKLADRPVPSTINVLHQFGVRVMSLNAVSGIDGFAANLEQESVVVLNSRLSNDRIRLNAVHELGHHLYSDSCYGMGLTDRERESRAFEFASNFLMPFSKLKAAFDGYSMLRLIEYKKLYGISLAAMVYRAQKAKFLPEKISKMLWREFAKRGWRKTEPGEVGPDRPVRFEQMLESAIRRCELTWAQAAHVTRIRENELRKRLASALNQWVVNAEGGVGNDIN
jgi:Zn-dependent peptidase ImmA (M78 family)